jgi:hypothetical protein
MKKCASGLCTCVVIPATSFYVPTLILNSWDVAADLLDDDFLDGIMPVLFAEDTGRAEEGLAANLDTTRKDLERLAKVYFVPETLNLEQAEAVVKKPRLGDVIHCKHSI